MPRRPPTHKPARFVSNKPEPDKRRAIDKDRPHAAARGYDYQWQKDRKAWLRANPLCVSCKRRDRITEATVVDHIIPHKGDKQLFKDRSNWQSLCVPCHNAKTARGL